jgi:hypothetical protein
MTLTEIITRVKRNPVIVLTVLASLIEAAVSQGVSWRTPALAALGVLIRAFTAPASEIVANARHAVLLGYDAGTQDGYEKGLFRGMSDQAVSDGVAEYVGLDEAVPTPDEPDHLI